MHAVWAQAIRTSLGTMCWMAYGISSGRCRTRRSERAWLLRSAVESLSFQTRGFEDASLCKDQKMKSIRLRGVAWDTAAPL